MTVDGAFDLLQNAQAFGALELFFQPLQRHADHVAMVEFRADAFLLGQAQPDVVQQVHVFGP